MSLDASRVMRRLNELAAVTDEPGRITRLTLSPAHRRAADVVMGWMREAGMDAHLDAAGNVIGRHAGAAPDAPALILGSHIDSVPDAGRFDGSLGVVAAIEIVQDLFERGERRPFAVDVAAFGDEEGVRFPTTLTGSHALAGTFKTGWLEEKDGNGVTRRTALEAFGCNPSRIPALARDRTRALGYIELHIEQGPVLEAQGLPLGVVSTINGVNRGAVEVMGVAGHAGTVPMVLRRDALTAAAEMVLAVEAIGLGHASLVATVGKLDVPGGAINTVSGRVRFTFDIRSPDDGERKVAVTALERTLARIARRRGVSLDVAHGHRAKAVPCDADLSDTLARAISAQGLVPMRLPSGAGHDAMVFQGVMPLAMLFIRCRGGVSHNPAESVEMADVDAALRVLADTVERLA